MEREVHDRHRNLVVAATGTGKTVIAALDYRRLCAQPTTSDPPCCSSPTGARSSSSHCAPTAKCSLTRPSASCTSAVHDPSVGAMSLPACSPSRRTASATCRPTPSRSSWSTSSTTPRRATYRRHHRSPRARRTAGSDRHAGTRRWRRRAERSSAVEPPPSCGYGKPSAPTCSARSTTSASPTAPTCAASMDARQIRRGRAVQRLHRQRRPSRDRPARSARQGLEPRLDARARLLRLRRARRATWPASSREAGIRLALSAATTPQAEREQRCTTCGDRRVNALFAADLFNEGLDLPDVDTVLFLRPTESATVFLQQLGRGLRRPATRRSSRSSTSWAPAQASSASTSKLRALTGKTRRGLEREIEEGFPFLPSGCQIVLDKQAQTIVLDNVKSQIANRWPQIVAELKSYGDQDLATFLDESGLELSDIVREGAARGRGSVVRPTCPRAMAPSGRQSCCGRVSRVCTR